MAPSTDAMKVLVIHPGAMGDLIQALPAFERLRARFANGHLALLVGDPFANFAREWRLFDDVIDFDATTSYHGNLLARGALFLRLACRLRRSRYAAVGVFKASPVYAALAYLSGAPTRVGLSRAAGARLLTRPLSVEPDEHRAHRFVRVAEELGASGGKIAEAHWPTDDSGLHQLALPQREFLVGIATGGARNVKEEMPERRWPLEHYIELTSRILVRYANARIVALGGKSDRTEIESLMGRLPAGRVTNLAGRTTVAAARRVIESCRVFITHDSGLLHLAGSTAAPIVAIFGPTAPSVVCPQRPAVSTVWKPAYAHPCHDERTGRLSPCAQPCCITRCTVDDVLEQVTAMLEKDSAQQREELNAMNCDNLTAP